MEGDIVCTIGKNKRIFIFQIVHGKKKRVSNEFALKCKNIEKCNSHLCAKTTVKNTPCRKKKTIFTSKTLVKEWCVEKKERNKNKEYSKKERIDRAAEATEELEIDKDLYGSKRKRDRKVNFVDRKS